MAVVLVLLFVGITALQTIISKREIAQERATATVAAQETGTAAAQAQETAVAQAKATIVAQAQETVAQAVTSPGGLSESATQNVRISESAGKNQAPKAVISGPTSGSVGETLSFSGANSTDPDGRIVSYAWNFGDGTTGSGVEVTHVYEAAGSYRVTLTVTDDGKGTAQVTTQAQAALTSKKTYKVQSGDTLMEISRKLFNGDPQYWDEIADLNGIKAPYTIYPGDELKVPEK